MDFNTIKDNVPESKSRVMTEPIHTRENTQLTEDGPHRIKGKKNAPLRKILNNLWGRIRG